MSNKNNNRYVIIKSENTTSKDKVGKRYIPTNEEDLEYERYIPTANNFKKKNFGVKIIANCPRCGNLVIENEGVWGCIGKINGTCNFSLGLDTPNEEKSSENVNNNQIKSKDKNQKEIKTQYSIDDNIIDGNSIDDNSIDCNSIDDSSFYYGDIVFRKGRKLSYKCSCGSDVYRYNTIAKCSNSKCNFTITTEYKSRNFSDIQLGELFGRRISPKLMFRDPSNQQEFKGRVFIDFDENLNLLPKYKFVSDINQLSERYKENLFAPDKGGFKGITLAKIKNTK